MWPQFPQELLDEIFAYLDTTSHEDMLTLANTGLVSRQCYRTSHKLLFSSMTLFMPCCQGNEKPFACRPSTFYRNLRKWPYIGGYVRHLSLRFGHKDGAVDWECLLDICKRVTRLESLELCNFELYHKLPDVSPLHPLQKAIFKLLRNTSIKKITLRSLSSPHIYDLPSAYFKLLSENSSITSLVLSDEDGAAFGDRAFSEGEINSLLKPRRGSLERGLHNLLDLSLELRREVSYSALFGPTSPLFDLSHLQSLSLCASSIGADSLIEVLSLCHCSLQKLSIVTKCCSDWSLVQCQKLTPFLSSIQSIAFLSSWECFDCGFYKHADWKIEDACIFLDVIPEKNRLQDIHLSLNANSAPSRKHERCPTADYERLDAILNGSTFDKTGRISMSFAFRIKDDDLEGKFRTEVETGLKGALKSRPLQIDVAAKRDETIMR